MKYKFFLPSILKYIFGLVLVVAGYFGSAFSFGNLNNSYLASIEKALPHTPNNRALVQLDSVKIDESSFNKFRQNVFKSNYSYSNAYRVSEMDYQLNIGDFTFAPSANLIDFNYNELNNKTDLMLFPSYGKNPNSEEECSNSIVLDNVVAEFIISHCDLYNSLPELIGEDIRIISSYESNNDENVSFLDLKISSIVYLVNEKSNVEYINMFIHNSHGSSIYISDINFNLLGFDSNCSYFSNIVYDGQHEYPFRTFYYLKELLGDTSFFVFPNSKSNVLVDYKFGYMSEITDSFQTFKHNFVRIFISIISFASMIFGFLLLIYLFLKFKTNNKKYFAICYCFCSIIIPILCIFLFSLVSKSFFFVNLNIPTIGTGNTFAFAIFSMLFLLLCYAKKFFENRKTVKFNTDYYAVIHI